MTVADLQQLLSSVSVFAERAGSSAAGKKNLDRVVELLTPYATNSLEQFAGHLELTRRLGEEFERTGQLPPPPEKKTTRKPATPRAPKAGKITVEAAKELVRHLYAESAKPEFNIDGLEAELDKIKPLTVPQLKEVAAEVHAAGGLKKSPKKEEAIAAIRQAIRNRWGNLQRVEL